MEYPTTRRAIPLGALALLAACGPSAEDVTELRSQQKQILAKLNDLEKKLDARPVAPQAAARPQIDPNKIYDIPIGASPVKGAKEGRVIITEFSDFQ
ncbi:MAG: hypothetical protein HY699_17640 [Deltaproteobacteria bacterium]|nr:hypothetical protein [Deltaproteobacteria bacterium]